MTENILTLEMHWMRNQCGKFTLKSERYPGVVKLNGLANSLDFLASLLQLGKSIESCAKLNDHLSLRNTKGTKNWVLHYRAKDQEVVLLLLGKDVRNSEDWKHLFEWQGTRRSFLESIARFKHFLMDYPYWLEDHLEALSKKWSDWAMRKLKAFAFLL